MRPKHEPTDSYLYLSRHLAKCMMRNLSGSVRMHKKVFKIFIICMSVILTRENEKGSMLTRANQKLFTLLSILWRIDNHKVFMK